MHGNDGTSAASVCTGQRGFPAAQLGDEAGTMAAAGTTSRGLTASRCTGGCQWRRTGAAGPRPAPVPPVVRRSSPASWRGGRRGCAASAGAEESDESDLTLINSEGELPSFSLSLSHEIPGFRVSGEAHPAPDGRCRVGGRCGDVLLWYRRGGGTAHPGAGAGRQRSGEQALSIYQPAERNC